MSKVNDGTDFVPGANGASSDESRNPDAHSGLGDSLPPDVIDRIRAQADSLNHATAFTQAIGVLMRSPHYREYTIGDLEWLPIPAITNRQYRLAQAKTRNADGSRTLPAAIVLWAMVSPTRSQKWD